MSSAIDVLEMTWTLLPEIALVVGALLVLALDLGPLRHRAADTRLAVAVTVGLLAGAVAGVLVLCGGVPGPVCGGVLVFDPLARAARAGVLVLAALSLAAARGGRELAHPAEYVALILFATVGMLLMAAAQQLLVVFLAIELTSIALYVLVSFDKTSSDSSEAGLKYMLTGAVAAAFLLFGFSLLYGLSGSIALDEIAAALAARGLDPLAAVALVMVLVAFGFKVAAAPFHLWAPDAYQGAPAGSAALVASASKLAGAVVFFRLLWSGLHSVSGGAADFASGISGWLPLVALMAAASMLVGNFVALAQRNVRRLLAYSAIAHAGALVLALIVAERAGVGPLFYYAATYGVATVGAFGVIGVLERAGGCDTLDDLAGLWARSPFLAGCLGVFVLSLAGIPPLAGFFAKFQVFAAALRINGLAGPAGWLAVLAILLSAVGLYYYLIILKEAFVAPDRDTAVAGRIRVPWITAVGLAAAALFTLFLGLYPSTLLAAL